MANARPVPVQIPASGASAASGSGAAQRAHGAPTAPGRRTSEVPLAPGANTSGQRKYRYLDGYDIGKMSDILQNRLPATIRADHRWDSARSLPHLTILMTMINADPQIIDIRWVAYMLATTYWETNHTEGTGEMVDDHRGHVRERQANVTMKPTTEKHDGEGRRYYRPAKILLLDTGDVQVTEYDGDQFVVKPDGTFTGRNLANARVRATPGAAASMQPSAKYQQAQGDEKTFQGRGYVQLTWWNNYAMAGVDLGLGMPHFLQHPEEALVAINAYRLMSLGMRTGAGFANGRKFSQFFNGSDRHYVEARTMVNGHDQAAIIAGIAQSFEDILWESRKVQ